LFAVADGMGGARSGETASRTAVEVLDGSDRRNLGGPGLASTIRRANKHLRESASQNEELSGMGTTLTAAYLEGSQLRIAHVGDSRAYLFRSGQLAQLTQDHSVVADWVREGRLSPEEAGRHAQRHVLSRALGSQDDVIIDEIPVPVAPGDVVLLCSDGLSRAVADHEIRRILSTYGKPQVAADQLVAAALDGGGHDNITVIVLLLGRAQTWASAGHVHRWKIAAAVAVLAVVLVIVALTVETLGRASPKPHPRLTPSTTPSRPVEFSTTPR
jgi:protein phosphatase